MPGLSCPQSRTPGLEALSAAREYWFFDPLTVGFAGSAVLANALVGRRGARSARSQKGHFTRRWLFRWLSCDTSIFVKLDYQSGRPDLNRRPLDPQSPPGHRWAWLERAHRALDLPQQWLSVAPCRLRPPHVGSWNGSFALRTAADPGTLLVATRRLADRSRPWSRAVT